MLDPWLHSLVAARPRTISSFVRKALPHRQRPIGITGGPIRRLRALVVEAGDDHYLARAGSSGRRLNPSNQRAGHAVAAPRRLHVDVSQLGIRLVALDVWHPPQTGKPDRPPAI